MDKAAEDIIDYENNLIPEGSIKDDIFSRLDAKRDTAMQAHMYDYSDAPIIIGEK